MTLPNFFVIGAGRSGTTSLHHYLGQHPDVYLCAEKSPNHFTAQDPVPPWEGPNLRRMQAQWVSDLREYEALFAGVNGETAVGEASPVYLQSRNAPHRVRETCPDARIVAILRQPADRAYAHFLGRRRDGLEPREDFAAVVDEELARGLPDEVAFGCYLGAGRYHHFLSGWYDRFEPERIRVLFFEDLVADPVALVQDVFGFLGVDPSFVPDVGEQRGRTGVIRNRALRFAWTKSVAVRTALRPYLPAAVRDAARPLVSSGLERPALDAALRERVTAVFRDDIERLQALVGRDLSHWL